MNFLQTISGTKYETQTSAVFQYLMVNCEVFRKRFIDLIAKEFAPTELPTFKRGLRCYCEENFVDVTIEFDNLILGIENKLWAGFQDDQPAKYIPTLEKLAGDNLQDSQAYRISVLYPAQRTAEVKEELDRQSFPRHQPILITWQDIQTEVLPEVRRSGGTRNAVIGDFLDEFLKLEIGKSMELNIPKGKVLGNGLWVSNSFHVDFLDRIIPLFASCAPSSRGGGRGSSAGFTFQVPGSTRRNWLGFIKEKGLVELQAWIWLDKEPNREKKFWDQRGVNRKEYNYVLTLQPENCWPLSKTEWIDEVNDLLDFLSNFTEINQADQSNSPSTN